MIAKKSAVLVGSFSLCVFLIFVASSICFRVAGAANNSTTRLSVQAITCVLSLIAYLLLRARYGEGSQGATRPRTGRTMFAWGIAGLLFALIPYALVLDSNEIHWENFRIELICAATIASLTAAIFEEIYFRDMLLRWMHSRYGVGFSILVQIILFGGIHFLSQSFTWPHAIFYISAAILFSTLWLLTEDFFAPLVAHFIYDFTAMIVNGVFSRQVTSAGLLLGETPAYMVSARTGFVVIAAVVAWSLWRKKARANFSGALLQ